MNDRRVRSPPATAVATRATGGSPAGGRPAGDGRAGGAASGTGGRDRPAEGGQVGART